MSFRPGSSDQPDSVTTSRASMVAPHAGQLRFEPSLTRPHQGQVCVGMFFPMSDKLQFVVYCAQEAYQVSDKLKFVGHCSISVMMHVHRLNTHAPWSSHARQIHPGTAEEAGRQLLRFDIHRH